MTGVSREGEEGPLNERNPHCLNGTSDDRAGDEAKGDDRDEKPGQGSLYDPAVACRAEDSGRDPPCEDECDHDTEPYATHEATVLSEPGPCPMCVLAFNYFVIIFFHMVNASLLTGK